MSQNFLFVTKFFICHKIFYLPQKFLLITNFFIFPKLFYLLTIKGLKTSNFSYPTPSSDPSQSSRSATNYSYETSKISKKKLLARLTRILDDSETYLTETEITKSYDDAIDPSMTKYGICLADDLRANGFSSLKEFIEGDLNDMIKIKKRQALKSNKIIEYFSRSCRHPPVLENSVSYDELDSIEQMDLKQTFRSKRKKLFDEISHFLKSNELDENEKLRLDQKYRELIHLHHFDHLLDLVAIFGSEMMLVVKNGEILHDSESDLDDSENSDHSFSESKIDLEPADNDLDNENIRNLQKKDDETLAKTQKSGKSDTSPSIETLSDESYHPNGSKIQVQSEKTEILSSLTMSNPGSRSPENQSQISEPNFERSLIFDRGEKFMSQWENPKIVAQFNRHAYNFDFQYGESS